MSSDGELTSVTSSSCDVESLQLVVKGEGSYIWSFSAIESGRERKRHEGGRRGQRRWYTLCNLRISNPKQGNRLKLVNHKIICHAFNVRKWLKHCLLWQIFSLMSVMIILLNHLGHDCVANLTHMLQTSKFQ